MKNEINITIDNKNDFYNKFDNTKLSEDLGNYIHSQSLGMTLKNNFVINIKTSFKLSSKEINDITDMIRQYFGLQVQETLMYNKFDNLKRIFLSILGIILIFISHFVEIKNEFLISEVFLIVGWGAIWEVFDNVLLSNNKQKYNLKLLKKLVKSKISFV